MHWLHTCFRPWSTVCRWRFLNEVRQILGERCLELENQGRRDDAVKLRRLQSNPALADYRLFFQCGLKPEEMVPSEDSRELHISAEEIHRHKVIAGYFRREFMRYLVNANRRSSQETWRSLISPLARRALTIDRRGRGSR